MYTRNFTLSQYIYGIQPPNPKQRKLDGSVWTAGLLHTIMQTVHDHWKIRSSCIHGLDRSEREELRYSWFKTQTEQLYSFRSMVMPDDRHIFCDTVEKHLNKHTTSSQLKKWLLNSEQLFTQQYCH